MRIQLAFPQASSPLRIWGRNFGGGVSIQRGKVTFSSWLEAPPQKVSPNSHKRGCSCRLSLHGRRKKGGGGEGRKRKSPFFPSSQCSTILRRQQGQCLQDVVELQLHSKYTEYGELCSASIKMSLGAHAVSLFYQYFEIMVRIASIYSLYVLLRRYSPGDHQKDPLIATNN